MEGYFREQEVALHQSTDECIKTTTDRVENMVQKIEDINQKENLQSATVQAMDHRLRKMEESAEQILAHLAVIHRFMVASGDQSQGSMTNVSQMRVRSISENDPSGVGGAVLPGSRRKYNRSYTEGQPDVFPFEDIGVFLGSAAVPEESESGLARSKEALNIPASPPPVQRNVPSVKVSSQSIESEVFERDFTLPAPNTIFKQSSLRQESTESKDTLTPVDQTSDAQTLVGDQAEDNVDEGYFLDGKTKEAFLDYSSVFISGSSSSFPVMPGAKRLRRRTSSMCRRNSESCSNYDVNRSHTSLHKSQSRRQLSAASEPDSLELRKKTNKESNLNPYCCT